MFAFKVATLWISISLCAISSAGTFAHTNTFAASGITIDINVEIGEIMTTVSISTSSGNSIGIGFGGLGMDGTYAFIKTQSIDDVVLSLSYIGGGYTQIANNSDWNILSDQQIGSNHELVVSRANNIPSCSECFTFDPSKIRLRVIYAIGDGANEFTSHGANRNAVTLFAATAEPTTSPSTSSTTIPYELCGTAELIPNVTLAIGRNVETQTVQITITGPSNAWFGYGFGTATMSGSYAVTLENEPREVVQRILGRYSIGHEVIGTPSRQIVISDTQSSFTLTRPYAFNVAFDFTDFMTCNAESIDIIAAVGSGTSMAYHKFANRVPRGILARSCYCESIRTAALNATEPSDVFHTTHDQYKQYKCASFSGETTAPYDINYYDFTVTTTTNLTIDACDSTFDTFLYFQNSEGQTIESCDDCGDCGYQTVLEIDNVTPRQYKIGIGGYGTNYGQYTIHVYCDYEPVPTKDPTTAPPTTAIPTAPTAPTNQPSTAPTLNPTKRPTSNPSMAPSIPTPQPTPSPKTACGTNRWCYYVDLYPIPGVETSQTIGIADTDDFSTTYFEIYTTINGHDCTNPTISVIYEEIDFSGSNEYFDVLDNTGSLIQQCSSGRDFGCGSWATCIDRQSLGVTNIPNGDTYLITIIESADMNAICFNFYSINAQITITCSADTAKPSVSPADILSDPCDCYDTQLLSTTTDDGGNQCYLYQAIFCDDAVDTIFLKRERAMSDCGANISSLITSFEPDTLSVSIQSDGIKVNGLSDHDVFEFCFAPSFVRGITTKGFITYHTFLHQLSCRARNVLFDLCGGVSATSVSQNEMKFIMNDESRVNFKRPMRMKSIWRETILIILSVMMMFILIVFVVYTVCLKQKRTLSIYEKVTSEDHI